MDPVAFLSYAHLDNSGSTRELSLFHDTLMYELSVHIGRNVQVFFDRKSIGWGKRWKEFIDHSIEKTAFLVPILTPAYFNSKACREEYGRFQAVEESIGRRDLILPVYYVKSIPMGATSDADPFVNDILARQYRDWRHLRHQPSDSLEVLRTIAEMASVMADTYTEILELTRKSSDQAAAIIHESRDEESNFSRLLGRPIEYETIIAYCVELHPTLPVSRSWTRVLLDDIPRVRYKTIRDIDQAVRISRASVDGYAKDRPDLFKYSTDYVTKALIFTDEDFRNVHSVSPETLEAARKANVTRFDSRS